jgi:hypothetical protein
MANLICLEADLVHNALIDADLGPAALSKRGVIVSFLVSSSRTPSSTSIRYVLPSPTQITSILHIESYSSL